MSPAVSRSSTRASAALRLTLALSLLLTVGLRATADFEDVEGPSVPKSLAPPAPLETAPLGAAPSAPTVPACVIKVLPADSSTSGNERAPNANFLFGRSVYLITQAEAAANGLTNGVSPGAIGWRYAQAPGAVAVGSLTIYLQNTTDTINNKSTDWATAIASMTVVHNSASTTLPNSIAPFDIALTGGSPFTYTGGGLYVAFDWQWAGPATSSALVACNSALANGLKGAQSSVAPPTTLTATNLRPETRITPAVATIINDASVDFVISLGSLPQPLVGPQTARAVVTNRGVNALINLPVTFNLTGVETFSNTQVVPSLAACGGQTTVAFAPWTPTAIGSNTATVSVPVDDVSGNNSKNRPVNETFNAYSYKHSGTTANGGVGLTGSTGAFVAKFTTTAAAKVSAVTLEFFATGSTTYRVAIYPDSGAGTPGLVPLYVDLIDRPVTTTAPLTINLATPVSVGPGTFFAGIQQTNTINANLSYDNETPVRSGAFYLAAPNPPTAWFDFSPNNSFKPNIGVRLIQCTTVAECNDNNACTDDTCTNQLCVHTNNGATSCDGSICTGPDQCAGGICTPGPSPCNDNNSCTNDACDEVDGCTHAPAPCNDNNACTDDSCNPATGCVFTQNNANACTDNDVCTTSDVCQGGVCLGQNPVLCSPDANLCTTEACAPATGLCGSFDNTIACNDGNACTTGDACGGGACQPGSVPQDCNDTNACTNDSCDPASGCVHTNTTAPCNDGNACTTVDTCGGGTCNGGPAPDCNDQQRLHGRRVQPAPGVRQHGQHGELQRRQRLHRR